MSDADLCNSIREFVASVGLPAGHVPSTKELAEHGRKDLANIVRRRGYKFIKDLLASSSEIAMEGFDLHGNMNDEQNGIYVKGTGQEGQVNDLNDNSADSLAMNDGSTGNSLVMEYESAINSDDHSEISGESPPYLHENVNDTIEESDFPVMNDVSDTGDGPATEGEPRSSSNAQNHGSTEALLSFQEKVENFMKYGQLDTAEDDFGSDLEIDGDKEGESSTGEKNLVEDELVSQSEVDTGHLAYVNNNNMGLNGTLVAPRLTSSDSTWDYLSTRGETIVDIDKDMNKPFKVENADEINRLKRMLHQKELKLSQLKEEVEKEKQALLFLQTKAENEISKAQKLISAKDAELHAAEESLFGLVKAKIQYSGEGQMVEIAGSFNGWHQTIKMEPQSSSATLEPIGSRKCRFWSTTLWLYPGVYEIKLIVDGQWKIDPQRESTIKGGIENNILRVDR